MTLEVNLRQIQVLKITEDVGETLEILFSGKNTSKHIDRYVKIHVRLRSNLSHSEL